MDFTMYSSTLCKKFEKDPILKAIVLHGLSPSAGLENISSYFGKRGTGGGQIQ